MMTDDIGGSTTRMSTTGRAIDPDRYDISGDWDGNNQDWWDWYVSLGYTTGNEGPLQPVAALAATPADHDTLRDELTTPYPLTDDQIDRFQAQGYIKLPDVLSPGATARLRRDMAAHLEAAFQTRLDGGANGRFLSLEMIWLDDPIIRAFVLSPRIAGIGARLLGVDAVRLYHDNLLSKEPECGRTPWHFDDHHFPLETQDVVTAWIPAQPIPAAMGPLAFAGPIDAWKQVDHIPFDKTNDSYDRRVEHTFRTAGTAIDDGPFDMGTVSFHHNLSFHSAGPNRTTRSRLVLANTYFADGARIMDAPTLVSGDWRKFIPDTEPGELAASPLNPICWPMPETPS